MKFDLITAEIGSTTTIVTAFNGIGTRKCHIAAQAEHFTTVNEGDVTIGITRCLEDISKITGVDSDWDEFVATSSAAGGLRMSVHGLVYDMTVRAAKEGALGAGGLIKHVTAGKIDNREVEKVLTINPNMILLAGGVDYGEKETILHNAKIFSEYRVDVPFVIAGNCAVRDEVCEILEGSGKRVYPTENVYPKVDQLNVEPIRDVIQTIFSEHIIHASGMNKIESMVKRPIIPTPAAVMNTTNLLYNLLGDVLTIDIGGATTDIDSVTRGSQDIQEITISPEPLSKRTVEGDLGVFVNAPNVVESFKNQLEMEYPDYREIMKEITPYPKTEKMEQFMARLAIECISKGLRRHAGQIRYIYGPSGRQKIAEGKDLTAIQAIVGTGGILTRSPYANEVLSVARILSKRHINELLPPDDVKLYKDKNYIFAPIGAISRFDKDTAIELLKMDIETL
ncbi:MAG TPA: GlmL-related ornithine degradation protein [Thermotogota bacterium]|nr:GlmL-related ornithine degradation protein [Thermotogota bacterium]HPJ87629.1 GlmL-related ornithine degradation protein [Thermotogota bacterium]HPR94933.1 GlmL-related ornithine degradation protein [Thermotogota bacterium]